MYAMPASPALSLGGYLQQLRINRGWSLRQAAQRMDISHGYLGLLEHDQVATPDPNILFSIASVYEVSYARLLQLAGYPLPEGTAVSTTPLIADLELLHPLDLEELRLIVQLKLRRRRLRDAT